MRRCRATEGSTSAGAQRAVEDAVSDIAHPHPLRHRGALNKRESVRFRHADLIDQQALGSIDEFAGLELLAEGVDLTGQVPELTKPSDRHLDRGNEIAPLERLDQKGERTSVAGLLDHLALTEGREHEHGAE